MENLATMQGIARVSESSKMLLSNAITGMTATHVLRNMSCTPLGTLLDSLERKEEVTEAMKS